MLMAMYYVDSPDAAFTSVYFMLYEACSGYTVKLLHAVGSSVCMLLTYLHLLRGFHLKLCRNSAGST